MGKTAQKMTTICFHRGGAGGAMSPRGDWRAPSDGTARVWLDELEANVPE